ncbi:hypothetical protein V8C86DRAFT_2559847 [Haematococcus lacustris]
MLALMLELQRLLLSAAPTYAFICPLNNVVVRHFGHAAAHSICFNVVEEEGLGMLRASYGSLMRDASHPVTEH